MTDLTLLPDMSTTVSVLSEGIARARERVWIESYICRDDAAGLALAECLLAARTRGADVRLLYDPLGSRGATPSFFVELAARGVATRAFQPRRFAPQGRHAGTRNHGRSAVLDDLALTGGANVGQEWLPKDRRGEDWHDVCVRIEGPLVADVARSFEQRWAEAAARTRPQDATSAAPVDGVEWISCTPGPRPLLLARYVERIRRATKRVWLENSYCLPPPVMLEALYAAAERGVDVQLILPRHTDLPPVRRAARAEYARWIAHGLVLHEYLPATLHAKVAVIDDDWSTVGTFNALSVGIAYGIETNVVVHRPAFAAEVAALFERDRAASERVTVEALAARGWRTRLWDRAHNLVLRVFDAWIGLA